MKIRRARFPKKTFKLGQKVWRMASSTPTEYYVSRVSDKLMAAGTEHAKVVTEYFVTTIGGYPHDEQRAWENSTFATKQDLIKDFVEKNS